MAEYIHLVKLCVGAESVEALARWQAAGAARAPCGRPLHLTRMWPRRGAELLAGGSLYWVIGGAIRARQRVAALLPRQAPDGTPRCGLVLDPALVRTEAAPRRPFQGWRYLDPAAAPPDLGAGAAGAAAAPLPPALAAALADLGVR